MPGEITSPRDGMQRMCMIHGDGEIGTTQNCGRGTLEARDRNQLARMREECFVSAPFILNHAIPKTIPRNKAPL